MNADNIRFRARAKTTGKLVEGYFVVTHNPEYGKDHLSVVGYTKKYCLFNDEPNNRSKGGFWTEIDPATLEMFEQLTLFEE